MVLMTSFEVVKHAIEFGCPDRLPVRFETLGISDVHTVKWNQTGTGDHQYRETLDEWGCRWVRTEAQNMGQVKGHPLQDWDALDSYRWPAPDDPAFYEGMEARFEGSQGKYVTSGIFMFLFERMHALHGFENTLIDLLLEHGRMERLADRIIEFDLGIIENLRRRFPGQIHGFQVTDDWGSETCTLIHPKLWCDFFQPRYCRLFAAIHAASWHVWLHSCGQIEAIIEPLIEAGVDVLNLQQPRVFNIPAFGKQFAGRVCFASLCDIQRTLPHATPEEIAAEADLLIRHWATPEGGFILSDYGDGEAIGVSVESKQVMLDAFLRADRWKKVIDKQ